MTLYVLTAECRETYTEPETYVFTGDDAYQRANQYALSLIAEYVEGNWDAYNETSVRELKTLIEQGHSVEARRHWNDMSTYTLSVNDYEPIEGEYVEPDFSWPEDTDA